MATNAERIRALKERATQASRCIENAATAKSTPTVVKEEPVKDECPFCGGMFTNLEKHTRKCKENPDAVKSQPSPTFDVKSLFDAFKEYTVTPDQLMSILKVNAEQAKADRDRLDTFIREHQTTNGTPSDIKDLVVVIKEQGDKSIETLKQELKAKNDTITLLQQKVQYERDIVNHVKANAPTTVPPGLAVMITSVSRLWLDLLKPIEQRWKNSTGYIKIIHRLKQDIETLVSYVPTDPAKRTSPTDVDTIDAVNDA